MTSPGDGPVRFLRAALVTGIVVGLTVAAHRLAGGSAPAAGVAALAVLVWPVALLATRRRLAPATLALGLGAGQALGHALLGWFGGTAAGAAGSVACLAHAAHVRGAAPCGSDVAVAAVVHADHGPGAGMVAAHTVATLLTTLLVVRGEAVLWRVVDVVLGRIPVLPSPSGAPGPTRWVVLARPRRTLLDVSPGRGPPAYAA